MKRRAPLPGGDQATRADLSTPTHQEDADDSMPARLYTPTARRLPSVETHTPEWHALRRQGIGGSDVSVILGLNPWKSPLALWQEKTGRSEPDTSSPSEAAKWGTTLEPIVARELATRLHALDPELIVTRSPGQLVHRDRDWQRCNPDGLVRRGRKRVALIEIKTVGGRGAHEWRGDAEDLTGEVARHALLQVVHSLIVTGLPEAYVGVLIGGQEFKWRRIERDDALEGIVQRAEEVFWDHVTRDEPPEPDGTASSAKALQSLYAEPVDEGEGVELDRAVAEHLTRYQQLTERINDHEQERELVKQRIQAALGNNTVGRLFGERVVTWKPVESTRIDSKRLRVDHPHIAEQYAKTTTSRRFALHI